VVVYAITIFEQSADDDGLGLVHLPTTGWGWTEPRRIGFWNESLVDEQNGSWVSFRLLTPNAPSPTVTMSGQGSGAPYAWVTVTAMASNYTPPVTYEWTVNGSPACGNESSCEMNLGPGGSYTTFEVTVTDVALLTASGSQTVVACYGDPPCEQMAPRRAGSMVNR